MEKLFDLLANNGGKVVSSNNCTDLEIAEAKSCGRMYVDSNGFDYIWFPEEKCK